MIRHWHWMDLLTDSHTKRLHEAKLFSVLGKTGLLGWWSWKCYLGQDFEWQWWLIACVLTAHAMFASLLSARFGTQPEKK